MAKKSKAVDPEEEEDTGGDESTELEDKSTTEVTSQTDAGAAEEIEQPKPFHTRLGDEFANLDEDAAAQRIQERLRGHEELQRREAWYQQRVQQLEQSQYQAQQAAQVQQRQAAAQEKTRKYKDWKAPEYSPDWMALVRRNETGDLVPINGADPTLPQKLMAFASHRDQIVNRLAQDPDGFIAERFFESPLVERVEQMIEARLQQQEQQRNAFVRDEQVVQWEQQHKDVLYSPQGQITPIGQRIVHYANELGGRNGGVWALDKALRIVYGEVLSQNQQAPAKPNGNDKTQFLRNAAQGKRNKAVPTAGTPSENWMSPHDRLQAAFAANGFDENHIFK